MTGVIDGGPSDDQSHREQGIVLTIMLTFIHH